jgi:hypothetical protein
MKMVVEFVSAFFAAKGQQRCTTRSRFLVHLRHFLAPPRLRPSVAQRKEQFRFYLR